MHKAGGERVFDPMPSDRQSCGCSVGLPAVVFSPKHALDLFLF